MNPPPEHKYTFAQPGNGSRSRIDHIYATENIINKSSVWSIENLNIPTDHQLISVKIHDHNAPQIGLSHWFLRPFLLKDKKFIRDVTHTESEPVNPMNTHTPHPQQCLQNFIEHTHSIAQKQTKIKAGMINLRTKKLEKAKEKLIDRANNTAGDEMKANFETASLITTKIHEIQSTIFDQNQKLMRANRHLYGKTINKFWCANRKTKKSHNTIMELRIPETSPPQYSTNSLSMANKMAIYHKNLQHNDETHHPMERSTVTTALLSEMPYLSEPHKCKLREKTTYSEVEAALMNSPNNKAAGINRIPIDLLKELHKNHIQNAKMNKPSFDIVNLLKDAYNNLETNGITNPNIQDSWLCPLYKKGDCCEIPNYRPIMVLNAEYKILTSTIMTRIAEIALTLIHKTQAAFIKGCSIFNQIDLAK